MGLLVNGEWKDQWYDMSKSKGKFVREDSHFRNHVTIDGSTPFSPESGRYHLYVSHACPWANRALIFRKIKKLESHISVSVVDYFMGENGWEFSDTYPDHLYQRNYMHQVYTKANPTYTGRVTVPVLWDKKNKTIVNNESSEIIRMLNSEFNDLGDASVDMYPDELRTEIDALNSHIYSAVNNGVYKCGFAITQDAYDEAIDVLFSCLDELEERLNNTTYLINNQLTEADWRLFVTLIRFDAVYVTHFKCNIRRIMDYSNLSEYVNRLNEYPGVKETIHFDHIKNHYFKSHKTINPYGIVPKGPLKLF